MVSQSTMASRDTPRRHKRGAVVSRPAQDVRSSEVWGLQLILSGLGYAGAKGCPLPADGRFGPDTRRALRAFQREHDLHPADGALGPDTRAALMRAARHVQQTSSPVSND